MLQVSNVSQLSKHHLLELLFNELSKTKNLQNVYCD